MIRLLSTSLSAFVLLVVCTISLGIFRNEILSTVVTSDVAGKAILLPFNFIYIFGISLLFIMINKKNLSSKTAFSVGLFWAVSALLLDWFIGYKLEGKSVEYLLEQFNVIHGQTWLVVLLLIAIMPLYVRTIVFKKDSVAD